MDETKSTSIFVDEANQTLLYEDTSSSSSTLSTVYKEIQSSVKIPSQEKDYLGGHQLSNSDLSVNSEEEYQKMNAKIYKISTSDHKKPPPEEIEVESCDEEVSNKSIMSLEDISSIEGENCDFEADEMELIPKDDDKRSDISLNQFILSLPIDDEIFYAHLKPVNRDPTAKVPQQTIEKDFEEKIVHLSEIFDPVHFWFQFVTGDEKYENFEAFHSLLNKEYNVLKERDLIISEDNFKVGLIVAVYVEKFSHWYRARIINNYNGASSVIRLFFIDYGTNGACKKSSIKYLYQHFMKYPQYCFRGRVNDVVPLNNNRSFKINHIEEFIKKISHHSFYATSVRYEPEEEVYQLELVRRRGNVNLREYLVEAKYAEEMNAIYQCDGDLTIGPPCYLIPTFQALEHDYPTYGDLENMSRSDIDFNVIIDTNYLHSVRRHEVEEREELQVIVKNLKFSSIKKYFYGFY